MFGILSFCQIKYHLVFIFINTITNGELLIFSIFAAKILKDENP